MAGSGRAMVLERPAPAAAAPLRPSTASPSLPAGELLLRVAACGVCRTDLQLCEGDLAARRCRSFPATRSWGASKRSAPGVDGLAHRRSRRRRLAGGGLRRLRPVPRGAREPLRAREFTGWDRDGGFATHAVVRADFALRIPDAFDDLAAAPLLCGGVIGYRSLKVAGSSRAAGSASSASALGAAHAPGGAALGMPRLRLHALGARTGARAGARRRVGRRLRRATPRAARRRGHVRAVGRRRARRAPRRRSRRHRRHQRHPPRSPAGVPLRGALVGAQHRAASPTSPAPTPASSWPSPRRSRSGPSFETHPLDDANVALARLSRGEVGGAAVLVPG